MEKATVIALLEKYWQAGTTVEEEKAIAEWFSRNPAPDPALEPYRALFAYFEEESQVMPGDDFEARILQAVAAAPQEIPLARQSSSASQASPTPRTPVRQFHWGLITAAASICTLVIGLFLLRQEPAARPTVAVLRPAKTTIKDTYDDPREALAAIRHALLVASVHLNESREQITKK